MIRLLVGLTCLVFLFSCASLSTMEELKKSQIVLEKMVKENGENSLTRDQDLLRFLNQIADKYNQHLRDLHTGPKIFIDYEL